MNNNNYLNATVFIIDDDPQICHAIKWLLESVKVKSECFSSVTEFLEQEIQGTFGCIVTDIRMPIMSGLQLLEQLSAAKTHLPVIIITGHGDIPMAVKAMKMGAVDFISKPFNDQYLLEQIQKAIAFSINNYNANHVNSLTFDCLSKREQEILDLIAAGNMNKQIAQQLHVSISTVEFHRSRIMKKTGTKNIVELIKNYMISKEAKKE